MHMKKAAFALAAVLILLAASYLLSTSLMPQRHPDVSKLIPAAYRYARSLEAEGKAIPANVDLQTLIASGHINTDAISDFASMKVTLALKVDESHPTNVVVRCENPDGYEIVALMDGSVHTLRSKH